MIGTRTWLLALIAVAVAACATLHGGGDSGESRLQQGLSALARRDYAAAAAPLDVASRSSKPEIARSALLLLAIMQMDPANPDRQPDAALEGVARLRASGIPADHEQVIGDALERVLRQTRDLQSGLAAAQAQRDTAFARIDSLQLQLGSMTAARDAATRRASQLEQTGADCDKELQKKTQELERIKRAIRG